MIFNVVTTLPYSTPIFNFLTISVGRYARRNYGILLLSLFKKKSMSLLTLNSNMQLPHITIVDIQWLSLHLMLLTFLGLLIFSACVLI